ncbi:hypothetical protein DFQ07_2713 [Tenacibaculum caenipelagi]|uniref:Uncharacterized protein n=2 Tax=Tenacibaculum caenipelagi TaxID=1325435 RepID=A0A4R6T9L8_9FLAO|nr:hypothetical protein DFQ07_2713 [Tenacibaculum caenipelagi]
MKKLLLLVLVPFLLECSKKEESDVFIGAYRSLDKVIPYPYLFKYKGKKLSLYNHMGKIIGEHQIDSIKEKDALKIADKEFLVCRKRNERITMFDLSDTINFPRYKDESRSPIYKYLAVFKKTSFNKINMKIEGVRKHLESKVWKYNVEKSGNDNPNEDFVIEKVYSFKEDKVIELTNYYYKEEKIISEHQSMKFELFKIDNQLFLSLSKQTDNPLPILQITAISDSRISLKDYSVRDLKGKKIIFDSTSFNSGNFNAYVKKSNDFENCFEGYQGEYYHDDVTYKKGNEFLINFVNDGIPKVQENKKGYIIIHFNINCNKKIGDFGLIQMTREYKKTSFSNELVKHLVNKVASLKDWPNIEESTSNYKDVHAFLMFKVDNGKIVDLCP